MMMTPDAPGNVISRGHIAALNEAFCVDLPTAVQKTKIVLEFCTRFGNGVSLPHSMDFSYLQHALDATNVTLQDLMGSVVDCAVNQNNRCCPVCLDLVSFTRLTTKEEWIWGIIPRQKCCLRSRQSADLVRLQKNGCLRTASGVGN
jgi:hypothetical protein